MRNAADPVSDLRRCFDSTGECSRRSALKTGLNAALALPAFAAGDAPDQDTVLLDEERQVIDNFAASDAWSMQKIGGWSPPNRDRVADLLFSQTTGIGLSCWRFNIGGGINSKITNPWRTAETFEVATRQYDWTRQRNEQWFLQAAKLRGVPQFLAFVNSPPGRLTRNGLTFCDRDRGTTNLKPGAEREYAIYLADILEHFYRTPNDAEQLTFDYVSPVNEPQWDWSGHSQEGNRASNDDINASSARLRRNCNGADCRRKLRLSRADRCRICGMPMRKPRPDGAPNTGTTSTLS